MNKHIELIGYSEVAKHIDIPREVRRLSSYHLEQLTEVFYHERQKAIKLYREIEQLCDIKKLNFAHNFNLHCLYLEDCIFNQCKPNNEKLVDIIILFFKTQYLIEGYLKRIRS